MPVYVYIGVYSKNTPNFKGNVNNLLPLLRIVSRCERGNTGCLSAVAALAAATAAACGWTRMRCTRRGGHEEAAGAECHRVCLTYLFF